MWPDLEEFSTHNNALRMNSSELVCRLCIVNCGPSMEPIFRASIKGCIADKIARVTQLSLRQGDGLPALICQQCIFQLDVADAFIKRCIQSNKSLHSLLPQQQMQVCTAANTLAPVVHHEIQSRPTREILMDNQECVDPLIRVPEARAGNVVQTNFEFPNCAPAFEAVDVVLPEHLILENGSEDGGEELRSIVSVNDESQGRYLLSRDPLIGIKTEALEPASGEETQVGRHQVKMEVAENFEPSSDEAFGGDSDTGDYSSSKTGDCDIDGDDNIVRTQKACNSIVSTTGINEHKIAQPSREKRFLPASKRKHSCPMCMVVLANRWSLIRHVKIHKRNERREQRLLAQRTSRNLSSMHSEIICQSRSLSESEDLDTTHSGNITSCSRTGGIANSPSESSANDAREILNPTEVPRDIHIASEMTNQHKCTVCSTTFVRHWNLVRHRKIHDNRIMKAHSKEKSSKTKLTIADWEPNKLNMIPIVKVTQLVITKDGIKVDNSLIKVNGKQSLIFSGKQSHVGQMKPCESMLMQANVSSSIQKTAGSQQVNSSFDGFSQMAAEMEMDHHKRAPFVGEENLKTCRVCNLVCRNSSLLKRHMRSHTSEGPFKCTMCNKSYGELYNLKSHMREHTEDTKFKCRKCNFSYNTARQLRRHEATHGLYKCYECGKTFYNHWTLKAHLIAHSDARPWKCIKCNSVFKRIYDLLKHQRSKILKCKINAEGSSTKTLWKNNTHTSKADKSQVVKKKPSQLKGLNVAQTQVENTKETQNSTKSQDARPYKCSACTKAFKALTTLKFHMLTHSDERPWSCGQCNVAFKRKDSLVRHLKFRKHKSSIEEMSPRSECLSSRVISTYSNLQQIDCNQATFSENPGQITAMMNEPIVSELPIRSEISAKSSNVNHLELPKEINESGQKKKKNTENSDGRSAEALEPIVTEPSQVIEPYVTATNDCSKLSEIAKNLHGSSQTEHLQEEDANKEADEPVHVERSIQMKAEMLTTDYHLEQPKIYNEMDESSTTGHFSPQENTAHTEDISSEPLEVIGAECTPDVPLKGFLQVNLKEEILQEDVNEYGHNEPSHWQNSSYNTEVLDSGAHDQIHEGSLDFSTTPDTLIEHHEKDKEMSESKHSELFPLQEATAEISENNDTENQAVHEIDTNVNDLHSLSSPHQTIGGQNQSCRNISRITVVTTNLLDRHETLFSSTNCDTTNRYVHDELRQKSGHERQHTASFYHSTGERQKSATCAKEFKINSELKASLQTVDSENLAIMPALFIEGSTSQSSYIECSETVSSENHSRLQSSILFTALTGSTGLQNNGYSERFEMPVTGSRDTVAISYEQESESHVKPSINVRPMEVTAKNNVAATVDCQTICMNTTTAENIQDSSAISLNSQHSIINTNSFVRVIVPQEQVSNVNCHDTGEERKPVLPMCVPSETQPRVLASTNDVRHYITGHLVANNNLNYHHQPKVAREENLNRADNVCQSAEFSYNVREKNLENNSKSNLKCLGAQKSDAVIPLNIDETVHINTSPNQAQKINVVVPLNIDKLPGINSSSNRDSFITTSSGIIPVNAPFFGLKMLTTEFHNRQRSIKCKTKLANKQYFDCKMCGIRFSNKYVLARHEKGHAREEKNFVCEGCNRSFYVTGSLGCNCLTL